MVEEGLTDVFQFQSTLPRGSDYELTWSYMDNDQFQSTLPRGSDNLKRGPIIATKYFNPRSLAGATAKILFAEPYYRDFNPRSLAGATFKIPDYYLKLFISIHAPSRERR